MSLNASPFYGTPGKPSSAAERFYLRGDYYIERRTNEKYPKKEYEQW